MAINRLCNGEILMKTISLDYATFEEKKSLEEMQAADYQISRNGGFGSYVIQFSYFLTGCMEIALSLGLWFQLCMCAAASTVFCGFLLSPLGSFLFTGMLLALLALCYGKLSKEMGEKEKAMQQERMDDSQRLYYCAITQPADEKLAKEVRVYQMADWLFSEWEALSDRVRGVWEGLEKFREKHLRRLSLLSDGVMLLSYLFVAAKAMAGAVSIGMFTRYIGAMRQMNHGVRGVIESGNAIRLHQSYLSFYTDFLEKKNLLDTGTLPIEKRRDNEYEVEFHDVGFCYPGSSTYSLRHVSLKLSLKGKYAVVGRNGAGKTTFVKLLCRLYDVTEGCITLNGIDIRKYDYQEYQNLFAAVFQDFSLFPMTVGENVSCGMEGDEGRIFETLELAGVRQRVEEMDGGLSTLLFHEMGDGEDISGGEAQKIAIARALYKDAPFVILDEPTAALDPVSEYEIYTSFHKMVQDKTSIYISHRMSSCRFCDQILVFDQGGIVQRGSHETLMKEEEGLYARLWGAQARYYEGEDRFV